MNDEAGFISANLFDEPEDFRPEAPKEHYVTYTRFGSDLKTGKALQKPSKSANVQSINLRLIGASPLWGHLLWNAGKFTAGFLDLNPELMKSKKILELGAAGGLPSLICSLNQPKMIVSTDYPDPELVNNIEINFENLLKDSPESYNPESVVVKGYIWGNDYTEITKPINGEKFDLILLSDLVFNHTEHHKLLTTCKDLIDPINGRCLVVFSPHRPKLLQNDLDFFKTAQEYNFKVQKIDLVNWTPMFEEDEETAEIRGRVYSFWLYPDWTK